MKALIKLALTAIVTYAAWNAANAWLSYYKFKDAVAETTQYGAALSDDQLKDKIVALANEYGLAVDQDSFTVRRDDQHHTKTEGHYTQSITLVPGVTRPFEFTWQTDTFVLGPSIAPTGR